MRNVCSILSKTVLVVFAVYAAGVADDFINKIIPPAVVFETLALNHDIGTIKKPKYRSPTALVPSPDGTIMYIAEQAAKRICVYDLVNKKILRYMLLPNEVTGIAITADGKTLFVTCASDLWPAGMVCVVNAATGAIDKKITEKIGHTCRAPVLTPDGTKLYVSNMFDNNLSVISTASLSVIKVVEMIREPYAAAVTPDGKRLIVGNSLPNDRSTDSEWVSCQITIYDTEKDEVLKNIRLTRGSHSVFGVAVSPDGKYAFATHLIGKFNLEGSRVTGGWLHTNNIAVIDIDKMEFVNDVSLDFVEQGMANPWEIQFASKGFAPDSAYMLVTHAGANAISMIRYKPFIDTVLKVTGTGWVLGSANDMGQKFNFLTDAMRKVVDIKSKGTRALAVVGTKVFTAGFFDDENGIMEEHAITTINRRGGFPDPVMHTIGAPMKKTGERQGEQNFYDADLCLQEWQSCASCHPLTRPDALNWILAKTALASPKNAKSMLYAWWTPKTTWTGRRPNAASSIAAGIEIELAIAPQENMTVPMDTFFMYMKPVPSPFLKKGRLSESALRGRALYYDKTKVDCIECHAGPLFYDDKTYKVGVVDAFDPSPINTPGLTECWRTGPYGHLGSYYLKEIFLIEAHSNMKQNLADGKLTIQDVDDLIEYVNCL